MGGDPYAPGMSLEVADYLAACALNPPKRERVPASPYR